MFRTRLKTSPAPTPSAWRCRPTASCRSTGWQGAHAAVAKIAAGVAAPGAQAAATRWRTWRAASRRRA
jgi:hypothetical protein